MKKLLIIPLILTTTVCIAHPRPVPRPHPMPVPHRHHCGIGFIGGIVGGLIGSVITKPVQTQHIVVNQPIIVAQPQYVWIEGRYIDVIQNNTIVKVWQPGHYEIVK